MRKLKVAIIGTGNIGCDLLVKIQRSSLLECSLFVGRNLTSKGMLFAKETNVRISDKSLQAILDNPDLCDIVIDATTALSHRYHAPVLKNLNKFTIDLTPSQVGEMCIPVINGNECLNYHNINMVTCAGQAMVPIAYAISKVCPGVQYFEIVSSIASKSAGIGTRENIDEFTQTTKKSLLKFTLVPDAKVIIVLNPAEPPITMHNTLYTIVDNPDMGIIKNAVAGMAAKLKEYVKGYKVWLEPLSEHGRVVTMIKVEGLGDYLPTYSGNLDIITCAAVNMAERYAIKNKETL
jgi:acetaldehyde dehydrogenase